MEQDVRAFVDDMFAAMNAVDGQRLASFISDRPGASIIGSDPEEHWTKADLLASPDPNEVSGEHVDARLNELSVDSSGDVAWAVGTARFVVRSSGKQTPFRWTVVCVREGDQWKLAHGHASIGVPNEELLKA
ncbi:MAG: nuclear transport factor 2 family protein [Solirubrobacterales bacterium]|nr:nuclear transport factor 2 family protein [Solirubrobacterales bacterium]